MAKREKPILSVEDLAVLGAEDDFFDAYQSCMSAIEFFDPYALPRTAEQDSNRKTAKKVCESLLHSYLYLFTDEYDKFSEDAYRYIYYYIQYSIRNDTHFFQFPGIFQRGVEDLFYVWKEKEHLVFGPQDLQVNAHIARIVAEKRGERVIPAENREIPTESALYLYDQLEGTSCYRNKHPVAPHRFVADLCDRSEQIELPVHFCPLCHKFFIGKKTLELFEKSYGKMIVETRRENENSDNFENLEAESKLHQLGYNVVEGDMTEGERQARLVFLIESGRISYLEVCATIERNIRWFQHSARFQLAVTKWRNDLEFIGQWVMDNPAYK